MSNFTLTSKYPKCYLSDLSVPFQNLYLRTTHLVTAPLNTICVLFSVILNALILVGVHKKRHHRTASAILFCSLNVKDLLLVSVLQPMAVFRSLLFTKSGNFCNSTPVDNLRLYLIFLYRSVSLTSMVLISIDRWLAIRRPMLYRSGFTMQRVYTSIALVWLISMAISFVATYLIEPKHRYQLVFIQFGITAVVVAAIQVSVYVSVIRHGNKAINMRAAPRARQTAVERAAATAVLYVIIALTTCYIPIITVSAIRFLHGINYLLLTSPWMELLLYANAVANPLILLKTSRNVRRAVSYVLRTTCLKSASSNDEVLKPSGHANRAIELRNVKSVSNPYL